ncbi:glycoside hydrolase [Aspergillus avenaceus]|uniref:Glucanase n=1 Tax=Aspergillus avenaceus TaxID=36643 RepID=A0A5N6TSS8_ASPAV|nr:glycoside hydrolase [Aspergillus avenaceus]
MFCNILIVSSLLAVVHAQQVGTFQPENHPPVTWQRCTSKDNCTTNQRSIALDANWRWLHQTGSYSNCYSGNTWDTSYCNTNIDCAQRCALEGADYQNTYGISTSGSQVRLNYVTDHANGRNVGSRVYMMESDTHYEIYKLLNQEFTFTVDVSELPCGLNGALYLVAMDVDGGIANGTSNSAGARYGTGYCDAQCPRDVKFIKGLANIEGWQLSPNNSMSGAGNHGSCCAELDIWESNSMAQVLTAHPCDTPTNTMCTGDACGGPHSSNRDAGPCDPNGCDFNPYRVGNASFYGPPNKILDSSLPFTVVTQFITNDGTSNGTLTEIRRFYVQRGITDAQPSASLNGLSGNTINSEFCIAENTLFQGPDNFARHGGLAKVSEAMAQGMVLVMSIWDDWFTHMLWLDSAFPPQEDAKKPGVGRGECSRLSGDPQQLQTSNPNAYVAFSDIKVGPINSTFNNESVQTWPASINPGILVVLQLP